MRAGYRVRLPVEPGNLLSNPLSRSVYVLEGAPNDRGPIKQNTALYFAQNAKHGDIGGIITLAMMMCPMPKDQAYLAYHFILQRYLIEGDLGSKC